MLFDKPAPLNLLICPTCKSTGFLGWQKCPDCRGAAMGIRARGKFLFWSYPLTRYHLLLQRGRRILNHIRWVTGLVFGINCWLWMSWLVYKNNSYSAIYRLVIAGPGHWFAVFEVLTPSMRLLFWLGALGFAYVWYRLIRLKEFRGMVEHYDYKQKDGAVEESPSSWLEVKKISRGKRHNISDSFTEEALSSLGEAYKLADKNRERQVKVEHLLYALLSFNRVDNIFIRLGISTKIIQKRLSTFFSPPDKQLSHVNIMPLISADLQQILFQAYEEAYNAHQEYVSVTELLIVSVKNSEEMQDILYDLAVDKQKLTNVIQWARIREKLYRQYKKFAHAAGRRSKKGMDKAMTALATPFLNQFSDDMTMLAQFGYLSPCIAREKEVEEIFRVIEGGQQNVILVGDHGVGKKSIIEGIAQKMVEDDVPKRLKDKRLVRLSGSALLAGTTAAGAVDRLRNIMYEIGRAGNVILFIHNLQELIGVSAGGEKGSLDVADTLAEFLNSNRFLTIATTTVEGYSQYITHSSVGNVFTKVDIGEMDQNQAIQVLESKVGGVEYKNNVFFAYDALEKAVQLSSRFLHDTYLPGNALEVMTEAAGFAHNKKGHNSLVTGEEVAAVVSEKTKIPVTTVSSDESEKLLRLEEEMHKRVVGQDEGVDAVANALRRARVEMRSTKRPIANFLFLGPTGVGKTELAKTIAEVYFGGENRMIRLDMSEYQDSNSISRMIGAAGEKGTGILTEAVRQHPFSLLLLDEIEKADKNILNLFLQVMDDGRLSDSTGRTVDFTNVILIATSNAGTSYVQEQIRASVPGDVIKEKLLHGELKQYFRPEFLNRFDGIILFKALGREEIKQIAGLMFKRINKELEQKGVELKVEDQALEFLADAGFDPEFGARPMRRVLEDKVENKLADLLLAGKLKRRDVVVVGEGGKISVE